MYLLPWYWILGMRLCNQTFPRERAKFLIAATVSAEKTGEVKKETITMTSSDKMTGSYFAVICEEEIGCRKCPNAQAKTDWTDSKNKFLSLTINRTYCTTSRIISWTRVQYLVQGSHSIPNLLMCHAARLLAYRTARKFSYWCFCNQSWQWRVV